MMNALAYIVTNFSTQRLAPGLARRRTVPGFRKRDLHTRLENDEGLKLISAYTI